MRSLFVVLIALPFAIAGVSPSVAEECSIRDSSLCVANPNCHWEYSKLLRGRTPALPRWLRLA
jgi:hypothetical protein